MPDIVPRTGGLTPILSPAFFSTQPFSFPKSSRNVSKWVRASARFSPSGAGGAAGGQPDALLAPSSERRVHRSISPHRGNSTCIRAPSRSKSRRKRRLTSKHACERSPLSQRPFAFAGTLFIGLGIKDPQKIPPNWGQQWLIPLGWGYYPTSFAKVHKPSATAPKLAQKGFLWAEVKDATMQRLPGAVFLLGASLQS